MVRKMDGLFTLLSAFVAFGFLCLTKFIYFFLFILESLKIS